MKTTPMSTKALKALAGKREADRRAEAAAAAVAAAAADRGLLDVALGVADSPVGELLLAVTPRGLACVAFEEEDRDRLLARLARDLSPRILEHPVATDDVRRQLDEYFEGERSRFELKLDRRLMRGIARDVLAATARVPFGRTTTYGAVAERIGRPRASRAVGNALGSNPIPIVVPCHRVLRSGGDVGGYAGGPSRKRSLLIIEGSLPPTPPPGADDTRR
jgi:methylated-DNA-[protein]-cysteine S-methyltransferase